MNWARYDHAARTAEAAGVTPAIHRFTGEANTRVETMQRGAVAATEPEAEGPPVGCGTHIRCAREKGQKSKLEDERCLIALICRHGYVLHGSVVHSRANENFSLYRASLAGLLGLRTVHVGVMDNSALGLSLCPKFSDTRAHPPPFFHPPPQCATCGLPCSRSRAGGALCRPYRSSTQVATPRSARSSRTATSFSAAAGATAEAKSRSTCGRRRTRRARP